MLIGEPGVGKTAIAEGLAQHIAAGDVPETLLGKRVLSLDLGSMVAGSRYRGEFEERIKNALEEIKNGGNVILFIDEIHTIVGAGSAEGALDVLRHFEADLARGEIRHRCHYHRRVPQVHREGRGAGTPFPAGSGGRALPEATRRS